MIEQLQSFTAITQAVEKQVRQALLGLSQQLPQNSAAQVQLAAEVDYAVKGAFARAYRLVCWPSSETHWLVGNPRSKVHLQVRQDKIYLWKTTVDSTNTELSRGDSAELALHESNIALLVHTLLRALTPAEDVQLQPLGVSVPADPLIL